MSEAIADRQKLAYIEEVEFAVTPDDPTFQVLRHTGETLKQETGTVDSQEIQDTREVSDHRRVNVGSSGGVNGEFSYGTWDDFIKSALMSANWSALSIPVSLDGSTTIGFESIATAAGDLARITDSAANLGDLAVGQIVNIAGSVSNDTLAKIVTIEVGGTYAEVVVFGTTADFVDEAAGAAIDLEIQSYVTNGVTGRSYSIERYFSDIGVYLRDVGMHVNTFSMQLQTEERITVALGFMGSKELDDSSELANATYTPANTTEIMTVVDNVSTILEGGVRVCSTTLGIEINNELRQRQCIGTLGAISVGAGKFRLTGSLEVYFQDQAFLSKYLDFTDTSILVELTDNNGSKYILDIPRVKISDASSNASGESSDVMVSGSWTAIKSPTHGYTMRVTRVP